MVKSQIANASLTLSIVTMVRPLAFIRALVPALVLTLAAAPAFALLPQTERDLATLEDQLRSEIETHGSQIPARMPILIAPPMAHWKESRQDFAPKITQMLTRVLGTNGALVPCAECRLDRSYIDHDGRLQVHNGELGLIGMAQLKSNPAFQTAQSMITVEETPGGIALRWIRIDDGRIYYSTLADSTEKLGDVQPRLGFAREAERRRNGESLAYVFFDLGIYPQVQLQLSWLEQWGSRNQFISGLTLSGLAPKAALGGTFMYMMPWSRKQTAAITGFYLLQGLAATSGSDSASATAFVGQFKYDVALGNSYGLFASINTQGALSIGITLFNPILFPFLL